MKFYSDINLIDTEQWQQLVETSSTASFFQTQECFCFYASMSFLQPFVFAIAEKDRVVGLMCGYIVAEGNKLKQYFSRRAIVPGGLLLDKDITPEALKGLLKWSSDNLREKAIYLEIRNYKDYSFYVPSFEVMSFNYHPHFNFHVATTNSDNTYKALSASKRRQIKYAEKEGLRWSEAVDAQEVRDFYQLLQRLYATKIKKPLFPLAFFEGLLKLPSGKMLVVKQNGKVMGGIACVSFSDNVLYEWFVCGEVSKNNLYPSVMATWAGIEYAVQHDYQYFDFMGAGKPEEAYGVREFKSKFGGELVEHGRFLYICSPFLYSLGKLALKIIHLS